MKIWKDIRLAVCWLLLIAATGTSLAEDLATVVQRRIDRHETLERYIQEGLVSEDVEGRSGMLISTVSDAAITSFVDQENVDRSSIVELLVGQGISQEEAVEDLAREVIAFQERLEVAGEPTRYLTIHGDQQIIELMLIDLVTGFLRSEGYTAASPVINNNVTTILATLNGGRRKVEVELVGSDSRFGYRSLIKGDCDVAVVSRDPSKAEATAFREAGHGDLQSHTNVDVIALGGVTIIVNLRSEVNFGEPNASAEDGTISIPQLRRLLSGEKDFGLTLYGRSLRHRIGESETIVETSQYLVDEVLGSEKALSSSMVVCESDEEIYEKVANDPRGVGFVPFSTRRFSEESPQSKVGKFESLGIFPDGRASDPKVPTRLTIISEEYPLSRQISLVSTYERTVEATAFRDFVISASGQEIVRNSSGFVDQGLPAESQIDLAIRMRDRISASDGYPQDYKDLIHDAHTGLSQFTIRYASGSDAVDLYSSFNPNAHPSIYRLVSTLTRPEYLNSKVILIGHTDSDGDAEKNKILGETRATNLAKVFQRLGIEVEEVSEKNSMGEGVPRASNESDSGKQLNRRVEIWVKVNE